MAVKEERVYRPKPIETSKLAIPPGLRPLIERLAENAHDHWALERMSSGWRHGPERDDRTRRHPNLVPYSELSEEEKELDRRSVRETILALLALGFELNPRSTTAG